MQVVLLALAAALVVAAGIAVAALRRQRTLAAELSALAESVRALSERVASAEAEVAHSAVSAGVAESLLVEKGIADEEDVAEIRRRFDLDAASGHGRGRDALH